MLIAHGPSGYLFTRLLRWGSGRLNLKNIENILSKPSILAAGIIGAILPDIDFIYHIFIDSDRTPHHSYWTHMPFFWLIVWGICFAIGRWRKLTFFIAFTSVLCLNALLHLSLDTLTGIIYWFYPFTHHGFNIFKVSGTQIWWVHKFMHHWTFLIEIIIISGAMLLFLRPREAMYELSDLFSRHPRLRALTFRFTICMFGIASIILVGSMRFNIDNKLFAMALKLKHVVAQTLSGS